MRRREKRRSQERKSKRSARTSHPSSITRAEQTIFHPIGGLSETYRQISPVTHQISEGEPITIKIIKSLERPSDLVRSSMYIYMTVYNLVHH